MNHVKTIGLGTISGFVSNAAALGVGIVTVPLLIRGLGVEPYGLLGVVSALVGFVGMADLGMTSTVTNAISYAKAHRDWPRINRLFSGGIMIYTPLVLFLFALVVSLIYSSFVSLGSLLSIDATLEALARPVIAIMLLYTAAGMFIGGMLKSLYHGVNNVHVYNVIQTAYTVIFSLAFIAYLVFGNITLLGVVLFQAGGAFVRLLVFYLLAKRRYHWFAFCFAWQSLRQVRPLLKYTAELFLTVLATLIVAKSDNIVLSHYKGVAAVAIYSIAFKLFHLPSTMFPIASASYPTVAALYEKRDWKQMAILYRQILRVNMLTKVIIFGFMAVFAAEVVSAWVGVDLFAGYATVTAIAGFHVLFVWNGSHILFTNAMFKYRIALLPTVISTILNLGFSIYLVQKIGMVGIALGTFFAFLLTTVWYIPRYLKGVMDIRPAYEAWLLIKRIVPLMFILFVAHYFAVAFVPGGFLLYVTSAVIGVLFAALVFATAFTPVERRFVFTVVRNRFNRHVRKV